MIPTLYSPTETNFTSNGLGGLADCISCEVTEGRNGAYTMQIVYPIDGLHFSDISHSSIIRAIPSDGATEQLFRVYKISKPLNGKVTIEAEHISYQLSFIPVSPFTASNCAGALSGLVNHSMEANPFTVWTDKETSATYTQTLPASFRSRLGGVQGSILDVYGGEYEFDNYTVKLHASRGSDNGVTLRYGKNITDIKQEENIENTITGICPYWTDSDGNTVTGDIQYAEGADNFPYKRTVVMDFSSDYENQPTKAELEAHTRNYISSNRVGVPRVSMTVSFVALWQTEEYKHIANLERVKLCDIVTVEFEKLGISAKAKVVNTVYDVLKERYKSIEIGETRTDLAKTLSAMQSVVNQAPTEGFMRQAISHANSLLSGGLGGHVVINRNANGEPNEILIMDTDDKDTAVNVIRMNVNGIGFSTTGYDGDYTTAWTIDGHFNADFIKAGTITAIDIVGSLIKGAVIQFGEGSLMGSMAYQPSQGFGGDKALTITGNTRVAIESTQYQCRMTGASTHVGASVEEGGEYVEKAYMSIYPQLGAADKYTAWTKADRVSLEGTDEVIAAAYDRNGYLVGLTTSPTQARLSAATNSGELMGVTVTQDGTRVSGPFEVSNANNLSGVVGSVTQNMALQYYSGRIYVYINGSQVGSIALS